MPGRHVWTITLILVMLATLFGATAGAQSEIERSTPISVDRPSLGGLSSALVETADAGVGTVTVRVDFVGPELDGRKAVAGAGGWVLAGGGQSLKVEVPAAALRGLARAKGIRSVRPLIAPDPLSVTSQGVSSTNAAAWHKLGLTGVGVKVAIVDFGFAGLTEAVSSGDLPAKITTKNYCSSLTGQGPHGTAVAEIVHDVAPAAQLYLVCVDDEFDLEAFVDYAIAQGIDIINHSGAWFLSDRGDGTAGFPSASNAARRADQAGILWVAAGGNYAKDHWKGAWNPVTIGGETVQKFGTYGGGSPDFDLSTVVPSGGAISAYLKWDNWPTTNEDLDLYLVDQNEVERARSVDSQADFDLPPAEFVRWVNNTGAPITVYIEIHAWSVKSPGQLDLLVFGHSGLEYSVASGSMADPAFSPHTVAVGASCFANNQIEYFSSRGPTIDGRIKPDFTSADGVITRSYGGTSGSTCDGFLGTSASAPHAAGLAALIMHAAPNWTSDRVVEALETYSVDLGPTGQDNTFGFGNLVLGAVPSETCSPVKSAVVAIAGPGTVVDTYDGSSVAAGSYFVSNNDGTTSLCTDPGTPAAASLALLLPVSYDPNPATYSPAPGCAEPGASWGTRRCAPGRLTIN